MRIERAENIPLITCVFSKRCAPATPEKQGIQGIPTNPVFAPAGKNFFSKTKINIEKFGLIFFSL
jgi:hypothetical protein